MRILAFLLATVLTLLAPAQAQTGNRALPTPAAQLNTLFNALAKADDDKSSMAIVHKIEGLWLKSESSTADVLMQRVLHAMQRQDDDVALNILNELVELHPDWAEAWNKRATVRFQLDDLQGALDDIDQVLKREPRHFGALLGRAGIYEQAEDMPKALAAYRQVFELAPQWPDLKKRVELLTLKVEGQGI